ncbi:hypothetical protein D3C83_146500 [compost metagenome]
MILIVGIARHATDRRLYLQLLLYGIRCRRDSPVSCGEDAECGEAEQAHVDDRVQLVAIHLPVA